MVPQVRGRETIDTMAADLGGFIELRFYAELNDFLPPERRFVSSRRPLGFRQTVKDLIEAAGVPHTEVDAVIVNGGSVGFNHRPRNGDRISVYPVFESLEIAPIVRVRPHPLRDIRFVVDSNLGALARHLRMLGFDAVYRNDFADDEIARISVVEDRVLLTRDVELLKRKDITHGYYVRKTEPVEQAAEVVYRFDLDSKIQPFLRCIECNELLEAVSPEDAKQFLSENAAREHDSFTRCPTCGRVYWPGSHHRRMEEKINAIIQRSQAQAAPTHHRE
jgi:uncharacterized protein